MHITLFIFISLLSLCRGDGVTVLTPAEIAGELVTGPLQSFNFEITGELALVTIGCRNEELSNTEQFNGKIVLFTGI